MSKRLKDVLDDNTLVDKTFWDKMFDKMQDSFGFASCARGGVPGE